MMFATAQQSYSRVTSDTDPYQIVDIAQFTASPRHMSNIGKLSIAMAPGKKSKRWDRDLLCDLRAITDSGVSIIVCLLEWSEMQRLGITDYPRLAQEAGLVFYHVPIRDLGCPKQKELEVLVPIIIDHLMHSRTVLVHCSAGKGRAGLITACCLTHFGYSAKQAIDVVRSRRPGAVQTEQQEQCVHNYQQVYGY
jgi:protein-tyrosine phosphatase